MIFGMQMRMRLAGLAREWELTAQLHHASCSPAEPEPDHGSGVDLFFMSYHGAEEDAGFGKPFDLSPATSAGRTSEGRKAAGRALALRSALPMQPHTELRVHWVSRAS